MFSGSNLISKYDVCCFFMVWRASAPLACATPACAWLCARRLRVCAHTPGVRYALMCSALTCACNKRNNPSSHDFGVTLQWHSKCRRFACKYIWKTRILFQHDGAPNSPCFNDESQDLGDGAREKAFNFFTRSVNPLSCCACCVCGCSKLYPHPTALQM